MNMKEILQDLNIPTAPEGHHHARTGWIQIDCPFCGRNSQGWRMGYSIEKNFVNCWVCGSHNLYSTLAEASGRDPRYIRKLLTGIVSKYESVKSPKKLVVGIPMGVMGKEFHPAHRKYLKSRGFDWQELRKIWGIFSIGLASRLAWRIFIPIIYQSRFVSWTTRSISDKVSARYISASEKEEVISHKELLYGEDFARHTIVICEGVFDVWKIGVGAVATFGSGYSQEQLLKMSKYPSRYVCFDNEPEAQKRAKKLVNDLSVFPGMTFNIELDAKDAAEESNRNIKLLRKNIFSHSQ